MEDSVPSILWETLLSPVFLSCFSFFPLQQCFNLHLIIGVDWGDDPGHQQDISRVFTCSTGCLGTRGHQMVSAADFLALPPLLLNGQ